VLELKKWLIETCFYAKSTLPVPIIEIYHFLEGKMKIIKLRKKWRHVLFFRRFVILF